MHEGNHIHLCMVQLVPEFVETVECRVSRSLPCKMEDLKSSVEISHKNKTQNFPSPMDAHY